MGEGGWVQCGCVQLEKDLESCEAALKEEQERSRKVGEAEARAAEAAARGEAHIQQVNALTQEKLLLVGLLCVALE